MTEHKKNLPLRGGKKGGTRFPQISLKDAVEYAKKLVSKTHTGAQPESIILTGVFGSGTSRGKIRASAMKQFGLMDGLAEAYSASDLAKKIVAAPPEELLPLLKTAFLKPEIFKSLYETFKGDKISAAKIRQQTANLDVHPENVEKCVKLFTDSVEYARLGQIDGDEVSIMIVASEDLDGAPDEGAEIGGHSGVPNESSPKPTNDSLKQSSSAEKGPSTMATATDHSASGRSVIHVNIDLDSSLDTEKLEKQLELLRRYGAI